MKSRSAAGAGATAAARIAPLLRTVREALVLRLPAVFRDAVFRDEVFLDAVFLDAVFLDVAFLDVPARLVFRALFRADFRALPRPLLFRELADFRERFLPALTPRGGIPLLREHALAAKRLMQARTKPSLQHARSEAGRIETRRTSSLA